MPIAVYHPPVGPPVTPVPRAPLFYPDPEPARWSFAAGPWTSLPTYSLPATERKVTWRLTPDNHEASFSIDGSLEAAAYVDEVTTDLWVSRNGQCLYRGPIGGSGETGDENLDQQLSFTSTDYVAFLSHRLLNDTDQRVYSGVDQGQIAWQLLQHMQAVPAGDLGIVQGAGNTTGIVPSGTTTFEAGTFIRDVINQLAQTPTGFDWDITPSFTSTDMTFDVWYPERGTDRQKIVDYPGQIVSYTRNTDGSQYANALRGTGDSATTPITVVSPTIGTDGARRVDDSYGNSDLLSASALTAATQKELATRQLLLPSYSVRLKPDIWSGPSDVWLGDPVTLYIKRTGSRPDILRTLRVVEISVEIDDDSESSTVELTLGAPKPNRRWRFTPLDRRLKALERR